MFQRIWTCTIASLLVAGAVGCTPEIKGRAAAEEVAPEVRFDALRFEVYRGATLEASGTAQRASMRRDTSALVADGIRVDVASAPGREPARLTAAHGTGNASDRRFALDGGVRAEQAGDQVVTERARYEPEADVLRGDAPVTVSGRGYVLEGPGFTLDPTDRSVRTEGGARLRAGGGSR